jgi:hypothetical protein
MWRSRCSRQIARRTNAKRSDGTTARDDTLAKSSHDRDDPSLKETIASTLLALSWFRAIHLPIYASF